MAVTVITPFPLVVDTESDDILDATGIVATTPSDGFEISAPVAPDTMVLLKFLVDGSGDTITIVAGDRPPSQRSGLGNLSLVLAASDVRYIIVDKSRFLQDDGTLLATCTDAGTTCYAFTIPKRESPVA